MATTRKRKVRRIVEPHESALLLKKAITVLKGVPVCPPKSRALIALTVASSETGSLYKVGSREYQLAKEAISSVTSAATAKEYLSKAARKFKARLVSDIPRE